MELDVKLAIINMAIKQQQGFHANKSNRWQMADPLSKTGGLSVERVFRFDGFT